jgi:radical SAM-linked protein
MDFAKYRIRFRKGGDLRLLSHHDLMRALERMLRRAALPFRSTEGFHPHPRVVFALSLPLGVVGAQEVLELELTEVMPASELFSRLAAQAPTGLELISIRLVEPHSSAQPCRAVYRLPIPLAQHGEIAQRCATLLAQSECWVERARPQPRRVDIRPYLNELRISGGMLEIDLRVTPTGSARADEVVTLLGSEDLLESGALLERSVLDIEDEQYIVGVRPAPRTAESPAAETV